MRRRIALMSNNTITIPRKYDTKNIHCAVAVHRFRLTSEIY